MFDLTGLWVIIRKKPGLLWQTAFTIAAFAIGWQLGKISSPYYAAHPIIFEDNTDANKTDYEQAVIDLKEEGIELREERPGPTTEPSPTTGIVSGAISSNSPISKIKFVGSVNSNLYHHPDCSSANRIKEANKIWFNSEEEAAQAGYSPSKCTIEKMGINN